MKENLMKICKQCNFEGDELCFTRNYCKNCKKQLNRNYYQINKEKILLKQSKYQKINKIQANARSQKYKKRNQDKIKAYRKKHWAENKENIQIKRKENSKIINEYKKEWYTKKRKNDPSFKLRQDFSLTIRLYLKKKNLSKNRNSILKFLPYTMSELKNHLEKQFELWMNWDNWSKYNVNTWNDNDQSTWVWNIDHIIPHCTFKYISMEDEEFKKCWSLDNLRPLSAKQNIIKGKKLLVIV